MQVPKSQREGVSAEGAAQIKVELDATAPTAPLPSRSLTVTIPGQNRITGENIGVSNVLSPELTPGYSNESPIFSTNNNNYQNSPQDHDSRIFSNSSITFEQLAGLSSMQSSDFKYSPISPDITSTSSVENYPSDASTCSPSFIPNQRAASLDNHNSNYTSNSQCILERSIQQITRQDSLNEESLIALSDNCRSSPETEQIRNDLFQGRLVNSAPQSNHGINQVILCS